MEESGKVKENGPSPEERERMIAEAAYFRAKNRGGPGDPVEDWIAAEREVDGRLGRRASEPDNGELAAYRRMRREVMRILESARGSVNVNTLRQAVDRAAKELRGVGDFTAESVNKAAEAVRREIASTAEKLGPGWESFSEKTADLFIVWRDRGGDFLEQAANAAREWLRQFRTGAEPLQYHTGELAQPGAYECTFCGHRLVIEKPDHLSSCPQCGHGEFRQK